MESFDQKGKTYITDRRFRWNWRYLAISPAISTFRLIRAWM